MIYENVLTWKKKLIKNEKIINVAVEEFSGVTAFLQSKVSSGSLSEWYSLSASLVWLKRMSQSALWLTFFTACSGNQSENNVNAVVCQLNSVKSVTEVQIKKKKRPDSKAKAQDTGAPYGTRK